MPQILLLNSSMTEPLSYRNQSIDLHSKSLYWFLHDRDPCHERVNPSLLCSYLLLAGNGDQNVIQDHIKNLKWTLLRKWLIIESHLCLKCLDVWQRSAYVSVDDSNCQNKSITLLNPLNLFHPSGYSK